LKLRERGNFLYGHTNNRQTKKKKNSTAEKKKGSSSSSSGDKENALRRVRFDFLIIGKLFLGGAA
jgi:hypothetical protein